MTSSVLTLLHAGDDSPDSAETVILIYGYWSRKFGGGGKLNEIV